MGWPCWAGQGQEPLGAPGGEATSRVAEPSPAMEWVPRTLPKSGSSCTLAHPVSGLPSRRSKKVSWETAVPKSHVGARQEGWLGCTTPTGRARTCPERKLPSQPPFQLHLAKGTEWRQMAAAFVSFP